jgi:hypothetical protein
MSFTASRISATVLMLENYTLSGFCHGANIRSWDMRPGGTPSIFSALTSSPGALQYLLK